MRISEQMVLSKINYSIGVYGIQDIRLSNYPEFVHDHSISIFCQGECVGYLHLERYTRRKYDNRLQDFLYLILKEAGLAGKTNTDVIFSDNVIGRSMISSEGDIRFESPISKLLQADYEEGTLRWYGRGRTGYMLNHELAHIYSMMPFYGDFRDNSLLVHFDGGASKSNFSAWMWLHGKLKLIEYGWDLEYLSSLYNSNALLFAIAGAKKQEQNSVPGKLMGLAGYGRYDPKLEEWLKQNQYFRNIWGDKRLFFDLAFKDWGIELNNFDTKNGFVQSIVATAQKIFERDFINKLVSIQNKVNAENLYYAGGAALNIVLNSRLVKERLFKDVFIPPCPGDSGLSLGAAAYLEFKKGNPIKKHSPYLNSIFLPDTPFQYTLDDIKRVALCLLEKKIVGVYNGYGEIGPRALGNRSIIALASSGQLAQKISMQCKKREWYRPVAPIMLERNAKYFTGLGTIHHLSKFMLLDFDILTDKQDELKGAIHIDGTSRIQTIFHRSDTPFMFDLLEYLDKEHQVRALINTSFNGKGEPIVHTEKDAARSAKDMKLDALVLNGKFMLIA